MEKEFIVISNCNVGDKIQLIKGGFGMTPATFEVLSYANMIMRTKNVLTGEIRIINKFNYPRVYRINNL